MKTPKILPSLALGSLIAGLTFNQAAAQTVTKADNTTSLQFGASYVGGVAPNSSDTIVIADGVFTTARSAGVGTALSINGIQMNALPSGGASRAFTISNSGGGSISLGAGGVTKAANTSSLLFQAPIALSANQTWTVNAVTGSGTGNLVFQGNISDGGFTADIGGAGRIDITPTGTITLGNGINLNTAFVVVNNSSTVVNLGNASQTDNFQIIKGRAIGSVLGDFGTASSFGDGGTNTAITMGGGTAGDFGFFEYTGGNASSNRTFNFDRRTTGSEIRNTNAASTLTLSGNIQNNQGASASINSAYSFGGDGNITLTGTEQLKDNTDAGFSTTLNKNGAGTLTITGANSNTNTTSGTFQGATNINAGKLIVSGTGSINSTSGITVAPGATFQYDSSTALTKDVSVNGSMLIDGVVSSTLTLASGSAIGGNGTVNGNISLGSGVDFVFSLSDTLTVTGTVTLDNSFGVASLVNADGTAIDWTGVAGGTYTLIANGSNFDNIQNFGFLNAANLGGGKSAYFQEGSLQLVVVPEPSTWALLLVAGMFLATARRRRP